MLQLSRFPWGEDPGAWLRSMALAADEAGFAGLAVMDHLIQIPQVDRAWEPIPEPWVTLGLRRRPRHPAQAGHARHPGHLPAAGHHRQGRGHARRADRRPRLRRRRRRVVGPRARGVRPPVPARPRAARRPRGRHRDDAGAVGGGHQGVRRRARQPARDDLVPAPGRPASRSSSAAAASGVRCASRPGSATPATCPPTSSASTASSRCCAGTSTRSAAPHDDLEVTVLDLPVVGSRPRRRLGAGRAAPRPHARGGVRREEARRHRRAAAGPVGRPRRPRGRHGVRVDARPRRPGRRARPGRPERLTT